jgi:hypothetical protein
MAFARNDHGNLHVTKAANVIEGIRIFGDIDDLVADTDAVKRTIGGSALDAGGFAVNGDGHCFLFRSRFYARLNIARLQSQAGGDGSVILARRAGQAA